MSHYQGINNSSHELPEVSSPLHPHTPDTPYTPDLHHQASGSPFADNAGTGAGASYAEKGARGYNPAQASGRKGWSTRKKWIVGGAVALICGQFTPGC